MDPDTDAFISKFLGELREDNVAVFVGAGLSKSAGFVDWIELLSPIAKQLGLDARKEADLVSVAQYHLNANAAHRSELNQLLIDHFSDISSPTENHRILARLPMRTYWTTNYDRLIERALEENGKRVDAKYTNEQLATTKRGRDAIVYKMHGDIEHPEKAVLTKDDYERYYQTHEPFITALAGDLVEKTFLFLGFSFTDPNLDYILSRIRTRFASNQRQHFCVTKHRTRLPGEDDDDLRYAQTKQALITQDLRRFNIKTLFIDTYPQLTETLQTIENRYRRRTIFISGSAADYGDWGRSATEQFLIKLAAGLIDRNFRIASGFGLGIGGAIATGAVQQIYSTTRRSIEEQLILRPFPIGIPDPAERQKTFSKYREELVAQAGVAVFIMGNKVVGSGGLVNADGVRAEFELARNKNLYLIPIGSSGWMSSELWTEVMSNFNKNFPLHSTRVRPLMDKLGEPTKDPTELINPILELIEIIASE